MKRGKHKIKYLKSLYARGAFGIVELEIRPADKSRVIMSNEELYLKEFKKAAMVSAEYLIVNYDLPKNIEIVIYDIVISPCDSFPLHIAAATIIGIFDICENPLSEDDRQKLDKFVLLNDKKEEFDFSKLELSKSQIEV
jgi:hypothetical protein